jgi:hypothetical protein
VYHDQEAGFLIEWTFEALYRSFASGNAKESDWGIYAIPVAGTQPDHVAVRYRGLDRLWRQLFGSLADIRITELKEEGRYYSGMFQFLEDAQEILAWFDYETPGASKDLEITWTRLAGRSIQPPPGFRFIGNEPNYFGGDWFSPISDCMCFPRWHGTDREGVLFADWFSTLNTQGLFDTKEDAQNFLKFYLSFDWTERGDYRIAEVWVQAARSC